MASCIAGLLRQLQELRIDGTRITKKGLRDLEEALPTCKVLAYPLKK